MKRTLGRHLIILVGLISCSGGKPTWVDDHYHSSSPDGDAFIYRSSYKVDDKYQTSLAIWVIAPYSQGGTGVFDAISESPAEIEFQWTSDSSVIVSYDRSLEIIRQKNESYFYGRSIEITYHLKQD